MTNILDSLADFKLASSLPVAFSQTDASSPATDTGAAVEFLRLLDPHGRHHLSAIDPDTGAIESRAFGVAEWDAIRNWIEHRNGKRNLYYSVNEPIANAPHSKLSKAHIATARAIHVDIDPDKEALARPRGFALERQRIQALVDKALHDPLTAPNLVVDSGGGFQMVWILPEPLAIDDETLNWVEGMNRALRDRFGGDQSAWDLPRILRLPGTVNLPDQGKRALGRTTAPASLYGCGQDVADDNAGLTDRFGPPVAQSDKSASDEADIEAIKATVDMSAVRSATQYGELPDDLRRRFESLCARAATINRLWEGDRSARPGDDESGSGFAFALAGPLRHSGEFSPTEFGQLLYVWDYSSRPLEKIDARYIARAWANNASNAAGEEEFGPVEIAEPENASSPQEASIFPVVNILDHVWTANQRYVVKGLLSPRNIALLTGEPNAGKSPMAFDIGACIAKGEPWCGMKTKAGYVLHFSTEGAGGMMNRVEAQKRHHFHDATTLSPLDTFRGRLNLQSRSDVTKIIRTLRERASTFGLLPALLVVDTLSHAINGSDADDLVAHTVLANCNHITAETGAAIILVHHPTKSGSSNYRGSSVWSFDTDLQINLERPKAGLGVLTTPRPKDFEAMTPVHYQVRPVELGRDEEGDPVTSIVIEWRASPEAEFEPKLEEKYRAPLRALVRVVAERAGADMSDFTRDEDCDNADISPAMARIEVATSDWHRELQLRQKSEVTEATFRRRRDGLVRRGSVIRIDAPKGKEDLWKLPVRQTSSNRVTTH